MFGILLGAIVGPVLYNTSDRLGGRCVLRWDINRWECSFFSSSNPFLSP